MGSAGKMSDQNHQMADADEKWAKLNSLADAIEASLASAKRVIGEARAGLEDLAKGLEESHSGQEEESNKEEQKPSSE
ncbi:hypothetical protein PDE_04348 [Penicillium oxalicum 114-2]|uniref:Uncharacterized protein n=1 Tax=Penicillium oxalicum (strain 114-2 / CGMCC 5302) TaxID=933388 RepID=S7ZGK5_PENO1|nr:hypothetical protein PDE_04348 [Penicillium oxalicum 114-2]